MKFWVPFLVLILSITAGAGNADTAVAQGTLQFSDTSVLYAQEAGDDLDCEDFQTQEEAQTVLEEDPTDPHNLDPNGDGIACALLPAATDLDTEQGNTAAEQEGDTGNQTREQRRAARQAERQQNQDGPAAEEEIVVPTCADFATPEEAQAAFDADPEGMAALDVDGNGVACDAVEPPAVVAPPAAEEPTEERRRNRRNQEEEPAPVEVEVVVEEPETRRNRRNQEEESAPTEVVIDEPERVLIQEDFDCIDFEFQEEAQEVYVEDPSDPYNLDPNGDGFACSSLPSSGPRISRVPSTGVGTENGAYVGMLVAAGLIVSVGAASATRRTMRR